MTFKEFKNKYQKVDVIEYPNDVVQSIPSPKVSVRVISYQHKYFIKDALEGVLKQQTDFPFEIVLGDDASNDGTREICIEYAKKYPNKIRLFLHRRENNIALHGQPTHLFHFIYNIFHQRGDYIAAVAGDDRWNDPKALQKQVDFLEKNKDYVISYYDANMINEKGEVLVESFLHQKYKKDATQEDLYAARHVMRAMTRMIRRVAFFDNIPEIMCQYINEDAIISSYVSQYGKGHYHPEIESASYRVHENSLFSSKGTLKKRLLSYHTRKALMRNFSNKAPFFRELAKYSYLIGRTYRGNKEYSKSMNFQFDSFIYGIRGRYYSFFYRNFKEIIKTPFMILK